VSVKFKLYLVVLFCVLSVLGAAYVLQALGTYSTEGLGFFWALFYHGFRILGFKVSTVWMVLVLPVGICLLVDIVLSLFKSPHATLAGFVTALLVTVLIILPGVGRDLKQVHKEELELDQETLEALARKDPFYQAARIDHAPGAWKAVEGMMDFDSALQECEKMGPGWHLPTREELLAIIYEIRKSNVFGSYHHAGIKTADPKVVVTLNPWERTASADFKNRVVCVSGEKPLALLEAGNWRQLPVVANWHEAGMICRDLGPGWDLPDTGEMTLIMSALPQGTLGNAWTRSFLPPGHMYVRVGNFEERTINTESDLKTRRHFVYCFHNY